MKRKTDRSDEADRIFLEPLGDRVSITDSNGVEYGTPLTKPVDEVVKVMQKYVTGSPYDESMVDVAMAALIILTDVAYRADVATGLPEGEARSIRFSHLEGIRKMLKARD